MFSTGVMQIDDVMRDFYDKYQDFQGAEESQNINLYQLNKTMLDILTTHMTYEQHQEYSPVAEELVHYVVTCLKKGQNQKSNFIQSALAKTFIQFGATFDIQNRDYWKAITSSLAKNIDELPTRDQFGILSTLKQFGMLKSSIVEKSVSSLKGGISHMDIQELVQFFAIYTSDIAQQSVQQDPNFLEKVDFYLSKNLDLIKANEFAMICNSIICSDSNTPRQPFKMDSFIVQSAPYVINWLKDNDIALENLSQVIGSIELSFDKIEQPVQQELLAVFEENVFRNCERIKVQEAVQLIIAMHRRASKDVVEVLDRIIGNNIHEVPTSQLLDVLKSFIQSEKARPKIFQILNKRIRDELFAFNGEELAEIAYLYQYQNEDAEALLTLIEPYIQKQILSLSSYSISMIIKSFYSKNLTKRFQILDELESILIANHESLNLNEIADLFYFYAKNRVGGKVMIQTLMDRFNLSSFESQDFTAHSQLQALIALNISGGDSKLVHNVLGSIQSRLSELSQDDLFFIDRILAHEQEEESKFNNLKSQKKDDSLEEFLKLSKQDQETKLFKLARKQSIAKQEESDDEGNQQNDTTDNKRIGSLPDKKNEQKQIADEFGYPLLKDVDGYHSDERSGDELTDSDAEFSSIIEVDQILKQFTENTFQEGELQVSITKLFNQISKIGSLMEFDSKDVADAFNNLISKELQYFSSYSQIVKFAEIAHKINLPYKQFWQSLANLVLMNYHNMEINFVIQILYYLMKAGYTELELDVELINIAQKNKLTKIAKYATYQLMIEYLKDQIQNVLDIEVALHNDRIFLVMLYTLHKTSLPTLMTEEDFNQKIQSFGLSLFEEDEGLNFFLNEFDYDTTLDLLRIYPDNLLTRNQFEMLVFLFKENSKKKKFFSGRGPTYKDVTLLLKKLKYAKDSSLDLDPEFLQTFNKVARVILQKAITQSSSQYIEVEENALVTRDQQFKEDLEFIQVLKQQNELDLFDLDTSKLVVFEVSQQILKPQGFESPEEAKIRLALMLYALKQYRMDQVNQKHSKYIINFNDKLRTQIFDNENFDKHLDVEEYILLRDITQELKRLLGDNLMINQQINYLERKIYNYSKLYTI